MSLFQKSVEKKYLNQLDTELISNKYNQFQEYFGNPVIQENIRNSKEEQFQEGFLRELFVKILDYTLNPAPNFNLTTELKNTDNSKKADGAILLNDKAIAVIELKSTNTTDLDSIETQAFGYKNHNPGCKYVITSNFEKLRFYIQNAVDHIDFNLFKLTKPQFALLWLCLHKDNLLSDLPQKIKNASVLKEEDISKKLYADYSKFRQAIYSNLVKNNPDIDKLLLFKKTQKLLDRFLFIFFAEDRQLVPANSITQIIDKWNDDNDFGDDKALYDIFKQYFNVLYKGRPKRGNREEIFAYNGGLFEPDETLDNLIIDDEILNEHTLKLSSYNFDPEQQNEKQNEEVVDVNILGHIFEHSLGEIENVQAEIKGEKVDSQKTKRKKDGIFYTPKYITKYIVENTVGKLCDEKKAELGIQPDVTFERKKDGKLTKKAKDYYSLLEQYRQWLLGLTILDPACGSGAFLNQALDFLLNEHEFITVQMQNITGDLATLFVDVEKHILENNIYGVDLNDESVEIAKLSLWLRTAQKGRKLNALNNNIKCGNSLIDHPEVAGEKAFNWQAEFPHVLKKGGFDAVIGNPPYGIFIDESSQRYYETHFPLTNYKINLYILFVERMLQIFKKGIIHFIIPKSLLFNTYYEAIRKALLQQTEINEIFTITEKVFEDAEVGSSLLLQFTITEKPNQKNETRLAVANKIENFVSGYGLIENEQLQSNFLSIPKCEISITSSDTKSLINKLRFLPPIKDYYTLKNGLNPGNIKHILIAEEKETERHKPIIWGKDISKYNLSWSGQFINYDENIGDKISLDDIKSKPGMNKQTKIDFALRSPILFENRKLLVRKTGDSLIACLDENNNYFDTLVHGIYSKNNEYSLEALLAILNSNPATFFYRQLHDIKGKVFAKISLDNLSSFPIPAIPEEKQESLVNKSTLMNKIHQELKNLQLNFINLLISKYEVTKITKKLNNWYTLTFKEFLKELNKQKLKFSLSEEAGWMQFFNEQQQKAQTLQNQINKTDHEIDQMVYQLYGLTDEEIEIVENSKN